MENKENLFLFVIFWELFWNNCFGKRIKNLKSSRLQESYFKPLWFCFIVSCIFVQKLNNEYYAELLMKIFVEQKIMRKNPLSAFASFFQLFAGCFLFLGLMLSRIVASVLTSYLDVPFVELCINLLLPMKKKNPTSWKTLQRCHQHLLSNLSSSENEKQWVITLLVLKTHAIKWQLKK